MSDVPQKPIVDLPEEILRFIEEHHVMVLSTSREGRPHAAALFYCFLERETAFLFTSLPDTIHSNDLMANPVAAASIHVETRDVGQIQGLQISGRVRMVPENEANEQRYRSEFLRRFPEAAFLPAPLWILSVERMKFTDNRIAFGHKILWRREGQK